MSRNDSGLFSSMECWITRDTLRKGCDIFSSLGGSVLSEEVPALRAEVRCWRAMKLSEDLRWRGLIHQTTSPELDAQLDAGGLTFYWGCDPTADSLHVGNLLGGVTIRRLQHGGHRPIVLAGGATGRIGDPSFKATERPLLDDAKIDANVAGIQRQLRSFVDFDADNGAILVNNLSWIRDMRVIEFLRDVGKHFTVNQLISRESVRARLEDREQGISFTEFSYTLLQGYDHLHLFREYDCVLQVGGSDQWGNILSGVELVRRSDAKTAHGLCWPLVTKADGTKFGKSESGSVWLDPARTSPYQFHQFFLRTDDETVGKYLRYFTFLSHGEIEALDVDTLDHPAERRGQHALADAVTTLVHGEVETQRAKRAAELLFRGDITAMDEAMLLQVFSEVPSAKFARGSVAVIDALVELQLSPSKSAARKAIEQGGVTVNAERMANVDATIGSLLHDRYAVIRRGKKEYGLVSFG